MKLNYYLVLFLVFFITTAKAQDLEKHQWKHRVILILSLNEDAPLFNRQIEEFKMNSDAFKARKLIVYHVLPTKYRKLNEGNVTWNSNPKLYDTYHYGSKHFEIILIGLDGGEKLTQSELLSQEKLFATIDNMPMRQAEMRRKN